MLGVQEKLITFRPLDVCVGNTCGGANGCAQPGYCSAEQRTLLNPGTHATR